MLAGWSVACQCAHCDLCPVLCISYSLVTWFRTVGEWFCTSQERQAGMRKTVKALLCVALLGGVDLCMLLQLAARFLQTCA